MPSSTVENYIKRIYLEQQLVAGTLVPFGRLAAAMKVVPGTVTTMVKALADSGLVTYEPRQGVKLTTPGEKLALHVLRRHRLLELFLVKVLHFDWSEVHVEAEELEHVVSDRLLERIDEVLGRPAFDPHGDPIPTAAGEVSRQDLQPLSAATSPRQGKIGRIGDQDPHFLRYATERGLVPGTIVFIKASDPVGESVTVEVNGKELTLGKTAAEKILVKWED